MTDSFLSTKMKQLKNIQATVESTTGETQQMWITKWYQLVRSIAKDIENNKFDFTKIAHQLIQFIYIAFSSFKSIPETYWNTYVPPTISLYTPEK